MNEQQRMEKFYETYGGEGGRMLEPFFDWSKDEHDDYIAPVTQMLWAAWQAAQYGQLSFKFTARAFGEK